MNANPKRVINLLSRAMRLSGRLRSGQTANTSITLETLDSLNAMLDTWNADRLFVPAVVMETYSVLAGKAAYTIGNGAEFNRPDRPQKITAAARIDAAGNRSTIDLTTDSEEYAQRAHGGPSFTSDPWLLFNDQAYPQPTLRLYPTPSSNFTLELHLWGTLAGYEDETQLVELPAGYYDALSYCLAERVADENRLVLSPGVAKRANDYRAMIQAANAPSYLLESDPAVAAIGSRRGRFNILSGRYS